MYPCFKNNFQNPTIDYNTEIQMDTNELFWNSMYRSKPHVFLGNIYVYILSIWGGWYHCNIHNFGKLRYKVDTSTYI